MDGEQGGGAGDSARGLVDPFDDTAPQPVVHAHQAHPHPHEGAPGAAVSPAGHHVAVAVAPVPGEHEKRRRTPVLVAGVTAAVLALVAVGGWALARRGAEDSAQPAAAASGSSSAGAVGGASSSGGGVGAAPTTPMLPASQPTLVLGDSLGLVVYPYLADLLPDRYVSYESEVGRSTAGTSAALAKLTSVPPVVIVSSGTNDGTAADLAASATSILDALGAQRCVVWVDVVRPERIGDTQEQMNAALDAVVAGRTNVSILRWSAMVVQHPEWLAGDGIHPTQDGAKARSQAYADASAACSPLDPSAPRAQRQFLPDSVFWGPISGSGGQGGTSSGSSTRPSSGSSQGSSSSPSSSSSASRSPSATSGTSAGTTEPSSAPATSQPEPTGAATATDPGPTAATATSAGEASPTA